MLHAPTVGFKRVSSARLASLDDMLRFVAFSVGFMSRCAPRKWSTVFCMCFGCRAQFCLALFYVKFMCILLFVFGEILLVNWWVVVAKTSLERFSRLNLNHPINVKSAKHESVVPISREQKFGRRGSSMYSFLFLWVVENSRRLSVLFRCQILSEN